MSNKTRIYVNLAVFGAVFAVMLVWAVQNVVSLDELDRPYDLVVYADAASGVSANAEVAYLGVHYGRVSSVELQPDGCPDPPEGEAGCVRIQMKIDRDREIPLGSTPRIFRKSPIGEPYVDFQPPADLDPATADYFQAGDEVPVRAAVPLEFSELLRSASDLISAIEPEQAASLLNELATALDGRGDDLHDLTVNAADLVATLADHSDAIDRLTENNTRLTAVLADHRGSLGSTITDLGLLAESLREASGDTQVLLDRGSQLLAQSADLLEDARPSIDCLLDDLVPVMDATSTPERLADLAYLLDTGADSFAIFAQTIDYEPDGPWARVNLEVDLESPPRQYVPPLTLPAIQPLVPCPGVVATSQSTPVPATDFDPTSVLGTSSSSPAALPATGAAAAGTIAGVLLLLAYVIRRVARAADA